MVKSPYVSLFVEEYVSELFIFKVAWQIYFRMEDADDEGGIYFV